MGFVTWDKYFTYRHLSWWSLILGHTFTICTSVLSTSPFISGYYGLLIRDFHNCWWIFYNENVIGKKNQQQSYVLVSDFVYILVYFLKYCFSFVRSFIHLMSPFYNHIFKFFTNKFVVHVYNILWFLSPFSGSHERQKING